MIDKKFDIYLRSMWLHTVKFIVKKSKCASLAQESVFLHQMCAACRRPIKGATQFFVHFQQKRV